MPKKNAQIVRAVYDAFNRGDWDAALSHSHPDFEATLQRGFNAGTHRAHELEAILRDQRQAFDSWTVEVIELHESGDQVVALVVSRVRPKGTDAEMELRNGFIWTLSDGKLISMVGYPDPDDALKAAGLTEWPSA